MAYKPKTPHDLNYGKERLSDIKTYDDEHAPIVEAGFDIGSAEAAGYGEGATDCNTSHYGSTTSCNNDVLMYRQDKKDEPWAGIRKLKVGSG